MSGIELVRPGTGTTPAIATQPTPAAGVIGGNASFSVAATGGTTPYAYGWYRNNTLIAGATGASYTTPILTAANNGDAYL